MCIAATTGVAATNIGGQTWHRASANYTFRKKFKPDEQFYRLWSTVTMMVIDEVSMMCEADLEFLNKWLQDLKGSNRNSQ